MQKIVREMRSKYCPVEVKRQGPYHNSFRELPRNVRNGTVVRRLEMNNCHLILNEDEIDGFLERAIMPIGTSGKTDIPRRYIGRRDYVIITINPETV